MSAKRPIHFTKVGRKKITAGNMAAWNDPKRRAIRIRHMREGCKRRNSSPSYIKNLTAANRKTWRSYSDEERREIFFRFWPHKGSRKINNLELSFMKLVRGCYLRYVGDGGLWINGFCPDFALKGRRKIVEVFGTYWHTLKSSVARDARKFAAYRAAGYDVLVIWEHEINEEPERVRRGAERFLLL